MSSTYSLLAQERDAVRYFRYVCPTDVLALSDSVYRTSNVAIDICPPLLLMSTPFAVRAIARDLYYLWHLLISTSSLAANEIRPSQPATRREIFRTHPNVAT